MLRFLTALLVVFFAVLPAPARALTGDQVAAKQAYVMDYETGTVLLSKDGEARMAPSSMTKVMTLYLVFEALENGRIHLTDTLPVSEKAWRMQGSKMFVHVGDQVKVEDLIRGVAVQSGNDATVVLAEGLAGSEEAFATAMNAKAEELGMTGTHFMNASGWPDPQHYSTAKDLATLARALISRFPEGYKYDSEKDFTYNDIKQGNRNPLLYRNIGADGVKTGHTDEGGYGLIGSALREGRRVIMVLNGMESMQARADESVRVMEWALGSFANISPYADGRPVTDARVVLGQKQAVPLVLGRTLKVTVPKMEAETVDLVATYKEPLIAPLKKGDEVGTLSVTLKGGEPIVLPLVAAEDVEQLGLVSRTLVKTMYALTGKGL